MELENEKKTEEQSTEQNVSREGYSQSTSGYQGYKPGRSPRPRIHQQTRPYNQGGYNRSQNNEEGGFRPEGFGAGLQVISLAVAMVSSVAAMVSSRAAMASSRVAIVHVIISSQKVRRVDISLVSSAAVMVSSAVAMVSSVAVMVSSAVVMVSSVAAMVSSVVAMVHRNSVAVIVSILPTTIPMQSIA